MASSEVFSRIALNIKLSFIFFSFSSDKSIVKVKVILACIVVWEAVACIVELGCCGLICLLLTVEFYRYAHMEESVFYICNSKSKSKQCCLFFT